MYKQVNTKVGKIIGRHSLHICYIKLNLVPKPENRAHTHRK